MYTDYTLR